MRRIKKSNTCDACDTCDSHFRKDPVDRQDPEDRQDRKDVKSNKTFDYIYIFPIVLVIYIFGIVHYTSEIKSDESTSAIRSLLVGSSSSFPKNTVDAEGSYYEVITDAGQTVINAIHTKDIDHNKRVAKKDIDHHIEISSKSHTSNEENEADQQPAKVISC